MVEQEIRSARRDVVTPSHIRLMQLVADVGERYGAPNLRLEGGTALAAYYLGHRESEDLDFFSDPGLDARSFLASVTDAAAAEGFDVQSFGSPNQGFARAMAHDREAGIDIKLDFAVNSPFRLAPLHETAEGIRVADYRDLCAGKLSAIGSRFEFRDFVDLHAIAGMDSGGGPAAEAEVRRRFRAVVLDLLETDPGLNPGIIGAGVMRGIGRPIVAPLPLRLIIPLDDVDVQRTIILCVDVCAEMMSEHLR